MTATDWGTLGWHACGLTGMMLGGAEGGLPGMFVGALIGWWLPLHMAFLMETAYRERLADTGSKWRATFAGMLPLAGLASLVVVGWMYLAGVIPFENHQAERAPVFIPPSDAAWDKVRTPEEKERIRQILESGL